jgi:hypothetical protein
LRFPFASFFLIHCTACGIGNATLHTLTHYKRLFLMKIHDLPSTLSLFVFLDLYSVSVIVISRFRRYVDDICALLEYYVALSGSSVPTFRDNLSVPSSRVKKSKKTGQIDCPETSLQNSHSTLRNIPEERRSRLCHHCADHRGFSLHDAAYSRLES